MPRVFRWLRAHPQKTPLFLETSRRLISASKDYLSWTQCLLEYMTRLSYNTSTTTLEVHFFTTVFFQALFDTPTEIFATLAARDSMLDIAILWWTAVRRGFPIVYPLGRPDDQRYWDIGISLMEALTVESPSRMAKAILDGRVCEAEVFVHLTQRPGTPAPTGKAPA